jgi:hypothetical protein
MASLHKKDDELPDWKSIIMRDMADAQDLLVSVVADINCKVDALRMRAQTVIKTFGRECMDHVDGRLVDDCIWKVVAGGEHEATAYIDMIKHIHFDASAGGRNANVRLQVVNANGMCVAAQILGLNGVWTTLTSRRQVVHLLLQQAFSLMQLTFFGSYGFDDDDNSLRESVDDDAFNTDKKGVNDDWLMPNTLKSKARTYVSHKSYPAHMINDDKVVASVLRLLDEESASTTS